MARLPLVLLTLSVCCVDRPPEELELRVGSVVDPAAAPGPHRVRLERGVIQAVRPSEQSGEGRLVPGRVELWREPGLPRPEQLAELLARGTTSLVLADRELVPSLALREYVGTARGRGPRVFVSGPELGAQLEGTATALRYRGRVGDYVALGTELVVIDAARGPEVVCAVTEEAHRQGAVVWLRADSPSELEETLGCNPRAVWLAAGLSPEEIEGAPPQTVWVGEAKPEDPAISVQTLNVGDALGRVAPGYVADLIWLRDPEPVIYIEGVRQSPAVPWLAGALLGWSAFQIENRVPDDL